MQKKFLLFTFCFYLLSLYSQNGFFSGSLQTNSNVFIRDTLINTAKFYETTKFGSDAWLNLNYSNDKYGLYAGVRLDMFLNSIVKVPTSPFTGVGLGNFYIRKKVQDMTITGGYIYDQIGSGIIYRSYEERPLGIDNSLLGMKLDYNVKDKLLLKGFAGVQKNQFTVYKSVIAGFQAEGNLNFKDKVRWTPGFGFTTRFMDKESYDKVYNTIAAFDSSSQFKPAHNEYAVTFYNTIAVGDFSFYVEGAYKTPEAINGKVFNDSLGVVEDKLIRKPGTVFYATANYSKKGIGVTLSFKRTENFSYRTSPNERLFNGMIAFIPPTAKQNSLRLPARYFAPSQEARELAFGADINYTPSKKFSLSLNGSYIRDFVLKKYQWNTTILETKNGVSTNKPYHTFFGEAFISGIYKPIRALELELGLQYVRYNRVVYIGDGPKDMDVFTPFLELGYKIDRTKSFRFEFQYQNISHVSPTDASKREKADFGQWLYGVFEFNVAPRWSFALSDLWNFAPAENSPNEKNYYTQLESLKGGKQTAYQLKSNHYPSVFLSFTHQSHKFTLAYMKNVAGIVCTGGVCRFEPAFSGVKFTINSTF